MIKEECRFAIKTLEWTRSDEPLIDEMVDMFEAQKRKIFDITFWETGGNIRNFCSSCVIDDVVFAIKDKETDHLAAVFILENIRPYKNIIINANLHCVVNKPYWGKVSRELCLEFRDYLKYNYNINKLTACVPQNGYGVIKLLKDIGFKHEATCKKCLLYYDKNNKPKLYDDLVFTLQFMEEIDKCLQEQ